MFALKTAISHSLVRCVTKQFVRNAKRDPGMRRQRKLVSIDEQETGMTDFEDFESDFMEVHKSHKEHFRELELKNEKLKYHIVKQKYFKEKSINFLTWHDKEQIRYLHRTDPDEWTIERLSEGFPALPETIKKIVTSNWSKTKQNKITNHDAAVQKNWKLFKSGQLAELPGDLKEHLKKFTSRALNLQPFVLPDSQKPVFKAKSNIGTEFSDIITSYQQLKTKQLPETGVVTNKARPPLAETYLTSPVASRKPVTLEGLQDSLKAKLQTGKNIDEEDKLIMSNAMQENKAEEVKSELLDVTQNKYHGSGQIQRHKKPERDVAHLTYPEKINIPKTILKKGLIYKLNDCYYDDDGEFLYRVPGMG